MKFPINNRNESIFKEINDFSFDEDSSDKFISNILYEKDIKNENIQIDNSQEEKDNKKEKEEEEEENKLLCIQGKTYDTDKKKKLC